MSSTKQTPPEKLASQTSRFVSNKVPLYYQLGTILREQILSGAYTVGDQLPTEAELVADYGVSRITVRQALKTLEDEQLIRREAGRGTFVTGHPAVSDPIHMEDTLDDLMSMGRATSVKLLELRRVASTRQDAETFRLGADELITQCVRLRMHHETPYSYIVNRIPTEVAESFADEDWREGSIMRAIEKRLDLRLRVADQSIRATLADAPLARLLEVRVGAPLLSVDRVVRTDDGRAVARVHTYYRSDIYSLTVHLTRDPQS
ncbi:MAG: GntR family transcriptional regulator [bacterium]|nr:GntR family transcriptional regulator [bacterium]